MNIATQKKVLNSLKKLLNHLSIQSYTCENPSLFRGSIGAHCRHIIEFYSCCFVQKQGLLINYDLRQRNQELELYPKKAISAIDEVLSLLDSVNLNDNIALHIDNCLNDGNSTPKGVNSSFFRELIYCMDHCIHHQSLIKIALMEQGLIHLVDNNFGVAFSTQIYRNTCV